MSEQFPEYDHEFKEKYATPIRAFLDKRLEAIGEQKKDKQILRQINATKKMAEDLLQ